MQLKLKAKLSVDLNINVILRENKNIEIASFLTNYKNLTFLFFHLSLDKHILKGKILPSNQAIKCRLCGSMNKKSKEKRETDSVCVCVCVCVCVYVLLLWFH